MKIHRILIAIDASSHSLAALDAAAGLAAMQKAELTGIFVEDIGLLRLAQLPFARELMLPVAMGRQMDRVTMEQSLKDIAERAREAVSDSASRMGIDWRFEIRRGSVLNEVLAAAEKADLLAIGKAGQETDLRVRLGAVAANLMARSSKPVLAMQRGEFCQGPALLVCDGSRQSLASLPEAIETARVFGGPPVILLLTKTRAEAVRLREKIISKLGEKQARFRRCSPNEPNGLARTCHEEEAGVVVLVGLPKASSAETLPAFLAKVDCPVLLYR